MGGASRRPSGQWRTLCGRQLSPPAGIVYQSERPDSSATRELHNAAWWPVRGLGQPVTCCRTGGHSARVPRKWHTWPARLWPQTKRIGLQKNSLNRSAAGSCSRRSGSDLLSPSPPAPSWSSSNPDYSIRHDEPPSDSPARAQRATETIRFQSVRFPATPRGAASRGRPPPVDLLFSWASWAGARPTGSPPASIA